MDNVDWLCEHLGSFTVLTVMLVSAHGGLHADTLICSYLEFFVFQSYARFLELRNVKPVERQIFQISLEQFYLFLFYSYFISMLQSRMLEICSGSWKPRGTAEAM